MAAVNLPLLSEHSHSGKAYAAQLLAAEAVLAHLSGRAPLRLERVTAERVQYALSPSPEAMQHNRGLLEDVVMVRLAQQEMARLLELSAESLSVTPDLESLLAAALTDPEEQEVLPEYICVLRARTRAALRRVWSEIQVVAAGLDTHHELDADAVRYRVQCAQGIRGTLLN